MIGWHQTKPDYPGGRWSMKLHWVVGRRTLCGAGRPYAIEGRNTIAESGMPKCVTCQKKRAAFAESLVRADTEELPVAADGSQEE